MPPYRIAVLECDTPIRPVLGEVGTYGEIFDGFLRCGLEALVGDGGASASNIDLEVTTTNAVELGSFPAPETVDAVLLTGSKHNAYENQPWILRLLDYVKALHRDHTVRLIGICFGHQVIARALGANVEKNSGTWEVAVDSITMSAEGRKLFGTEHLALHQMHQDIVTSVPAGATNLGSSTVCKVQGLHVPKRVLSLQAHPEFSGFIMSKLLELRHEQNVFSDEIYESGMSRAAKDHDGLLVSKVIWKFLLDHGD